ncbi:MAG: DUF2062 domain-containing protein [Pseudomonadota bacterium]
MLFRRRKPIGIPEKLRIFFWPRRSFARSFQYFIKRILRLTATPHAIAAGAAAGAMASWTPFIGFHFIIGAVFAYLLAGNILASALGTGFGNPLTFPFIWSGTYVVGNRILDNGVDGTMPRLDLSELNYFELWDPIIKPMLVGCIPFMLVTGATLYVLAYFGVSTFQAQRKRRLMKKRRKELSGQQTV